MGCLSRIYEGDIDVLRAKVESLRENIESTFKVKVSLKELDEKKKKKKIKYVSRDSDTDEEDVE